MLVGEAVNTRDFQPDLLNLHIQMPVLSNLLSNICLSFAFSHFWQLNECQEWAVAHPLHIPWAMMATISDPVIHDV